MLIGILQICASSISMVLGGRRSHVGLQDTRVTCEVHPHALTVVIVADPICARFRSNSIALACFRTCAWGQWYYQGLYMPSPASGPETLTVQVMQCKGEACTAWLSSC
jgi:hypothetical protein